jgi:hypothetical protein
LKNRIEHINLLPGTIDSKEKATSNNYLFTISSLVILNYSYFSDGKGIDKKYLDSDYGFEEVLVPERQPDDLYHQSQINTIKKNESNQLKELSNIAKSAIKLCDEIKLSKIWEANTLFLFYYIGMCVLYPFSLLIASDNQVFQKTKIPFVFSHKKNFFL